VIWAKIIACETRYEHVCFTYRAVLRLAGGGHGISHLLHHPQYLQRLFLRCFL
jgi:hypothetical protein